MSGNFDERVSVAVVTGATASGKSAYALKEMHKSDSAILNADALQLYQGLPYLSAQPSGQERACMPHLLYGILAPDAPLYSAAAWARICEKTLKSLISKGKAPCVVGGSGFYLQALLEGLSPIPDVSDALFVQINQETDPLSSLDLYARVREEDPVMAARLHPHDRQRLVRALCVKRASGRSLAYWQDRPRKRFPFSFHVTWLKPPRAYLHRRIEVRLKRSWLDILEDVRSFSENSAFSPQALRALPLARTLGFCEVLDFLDGRVSQEAAQERILALTRQYAKRQETFLRFLMRRLSRLEIPFKVQEETNS